MSKRFFIVSICFLLATALAAHAQEVKERISGPITVTSETLTNDSRQHTALFEKNVVAKTTDMTIHADKMLVFYKEQGGDVTRIDATGNVKVYKGTRLITSQAAVYYADEDKVVFTGDPRAVDGENVVTGSVITYYVKDDRSVVEHSKVFLKNKPGK
jgi:lipopolysaccharide export system protein LptA